MGGGCFQKFLKFSFTDNVMGEGAGVGGFLERLLMAIGLSSGLAPQVSPLLTKALGSAPELQHCLIHSGHTGYLSILPFSYGALSLSNL